MRPGLLLDDALRALEGAARRLAGPVPAPAWSAPLRRQRAIRGPGTPGARGPARARLAEWLAVRAGHRARLDRRAVRYLCWEPGVATDPAFHAHVDGLGVALDLRALQGLLRACHVRWSPALLAGPAPAWVRGRLLAYPCGPRLADRLAERWRRDAAWLLGPAGPHELAARLAVRRQPVPLVCREWGIDPRTAFVREAVRLAVQGWRKRLEAGPPETDRLDAAYLLGWPGWTATAFKTEVAATLLGVPPGARATRAALLRFVREEPRLGDPRRGAAEPAWRSMDPEAAQRVVAWIAEEDLDFFYGHLVPPPAGPARRAFWQGYIPAIRVSRVLLTLEDELRWALGRPPGGQAPAGGGFGRVLGADSALLLVFDHALAVEHAREGAVDVYARAAAADLLDALGAGGEAATRALDRPRVRVARVRLEREGPATLAAVLAAYGAVPAAGAA